MSKILVTAANGQLGQLVVRQLLERVPADRIVAGVRRLESAGPLEQLGVEVRHLDYEKAETLESALSGVGRVLLISSSEVGKRAAQHLRVIEAASRARVDLLVYTSLLRADSSPLALGVEHLATEKALAASNVPYTVLRNGWYTENLTAGIPAALAHGAVLGSSGEGKISAASRLDYAEAAAIVLTRPSMVSGLVYELAGDGAFSKPEFAREVSELSGREVVYKNLTQEEYQSALEGAGLPAPFANILADSDAGTANGALFDEKGELAQLLGRPTTDWRQTVAEAVSRLESGSAA